MRTIFSYLIIAIVVWAATGCGATRALPENERLYTGASVKVEGEGLTAKQRKVLRNDLSALTRPRPNTRFLGLPLKLNIYSLFRNKKKGLFKNIRDKFGEPPVLFSEFDLTKNNQVLQSYLENKGFFDAKVTGT